MLSVAINSKVYYHTIKNCKQELHLQMDITTYKVKAPIQRRIALIADLHDYPQGKVVGAVRAIAPDLVVIAGDFMSSRYLSFILDMVGIAPTFVGMGNHEEHLKTVVCEKIEKAGAVPLDNRSICFNGIIIGGMSTGYDLEWLDSFSSHQGYKILICHHPEYYPKFLKNKSIDLILSGHAHGGQIRLFGKGLFSPGQGLFPKYTCGVYEGKLVVSRGIGNMVKVPRLFNKSEVVCVELGPEVLKERYAN
jgi:predicted MPP superfamily phosphohydrolase